MVAWRIDNFQAASEQTAPTHFAVEEIGPIVVLAAKQNRAAVQLMVTVVVAGIDEQFLPNLPVHSAEWLVGLNFRFQRGSRAEIPDQPRCSIFCLYAGSQHQVTCMGKQRVS